MNEKEEVRMKRLNRLLIESLILGVAVILLAGCGIPQADYEAVQSELAEIKEVYPPEDFSSLSELNDWLLGNDVSEKPITTYGEDWYGRALEVQEDALMDGYIVSADYDYDAEDDSYLVWCTTIINGRVFYWDPETNDVSEDTVIGTVK